MNRIYTGEAERTKVRNRKESKNGAIECGLVTMAEDNGNA
jgi:hypothetical protein